jgi:hypothetical protein
MDGGQTASTIKEKEIIRQLHLVRSTTENVKKSALSLTDRTLPVSRGVSPEVGQEKKNTISPIIVVSELEIIQGMLLDIDSILQSNIERLEV